MATSKGTSMKPGIQAALVLMAAAYVFAPVSVLLGGHNPLGTRAILLFDLYLAATLICCAKASGERLFVPATGLAFLHAALCVARPEITGGHSEWALFATVPLMAALVGAAGARIAYRSEWLVPALGFCATILVTIISICTGDLAIFLGVFAAQALLWLVLSCVVHPRAEESLDGTGRNSAGGYRQ